MFLNFKIFFRIHGNLHRHHQLLRSHGDVFVLLLQLLPEQETSQSHEAHQTFHYCYAAGSIHNYHRPSNDCDSAKLRMRLLLPFAVNKLYRINFPLRPILHSNIH